ncbi:hypothetical protein URH17368_0521 [Alicyclobacillus hesperidum URH17-3-68]|uniref:hypothetical protein n=1 Tax=Alicyclobacillus hesperidum TaxID=89784 RepID=UPI000281B83C|nr:hypothetical protein [Alicyclobacillus hesperidum]EJY56556.1 hypothetical protein URH17368_0521 [Alicyclobacillus hesperidum URH17-3-68]
MADRKTWMLRTAAFAVCAGSVAVPVTQASVVRPTPVMEQRTIVLNGEPTQAKPYTFSQNGVVYMPLWYVMNVLQQLGFLNTWKQGVWNVTVPMSIPADTSPDTESAGNAAIALNGAVVQRLQGIAATDPASGKLTMFFPVANIEQLMARLGIVATWDGTTLSLDTSALPTPLAADQIGIWNLLVAVDQAFGVAPDTSGTSPYADLSTNSPAWGYVHASIEKGIYQPISSNQAGVFAPLTVAMADQVLWNAYGISSDDAAYQPGGSPVAWASAVGLVPSPWKSTDFLTPQELATVVSNVHNNLKGFVETGKSSWQICYPIGDEATASFAGDSRNGQPFFPSNASVQSAVGQTYQFFDSLQVVKQGHSYVLVVPNPPTGTGFCYITTFGNVTYEISGQSKWTNAFVLDTRDVQWAKGHTLLVLIPSSGLTITWNQMLPLFSGTVVLGELQLSAGAQGLQVQRMNINSSTTS